MMLRLFTEKDVRKLVARLKEEYDGVLAATRASFDEIKEENRVLRARLLELEGERGAVADAMVAAVREQERAKRTGEESTERDRRELRLLIARCREYLSRLQKKYPDKEETAAFSAFLEELSPHFGEEEESGFDLDEVTSPKYPLDLGKLCKDLGLMEDDE